MITIKERPLSREFDSTSAQIGYLVIADEAETEAQIRAAIEEEIPTTMASHKLRDVRCDEIQLNPDEAFGPLMWDVIARYGTRVAIFPLPPTGTVIWSGTTAGGSERISHGLKFRENTVPGAGSYRWLGESFTAWRVADWKFPTTWGAVGATKDGVAGVERVLPVNQFQAVKYVAAEDWEDLWEAAELLTGKTNDDEFIADVREYAIGEVLFLGLLGWTKRTEVDPADYEVTFGFAAGRKVTELKIGGVPAEPPLIEKDPWDYLDVLFEPHQVSGEVVMVQRPVAVTVHRIYEAGDFDVLGL